MKKNPHISDTTLDSMIEKRKERSPGFTKLYEEELKKREQEQARKKSPAKRRKK